LEVYSRTRKGLTCSESKIPSSVSHTGAKCLEFCQVDDREMYIRT
jgi:hypothetical protein